MSWKTIFKIKISAAAFILCCSVCLYAKRDKSPIYIFNQAQKHYEQRQYELAIRQLKSLLNRKIKKDLKKRTYLLLGMAYQKTGKYDKSLSIYQLAVELFPKDTDLLIALGSLYYRFDLLGNAKELIEKALEISPDDLDANKYMAYTYEKLGFLPEASAKYEKALKNSKEITEELWYKYAVCLYKQRKFKKARDAAEIALEHLPENTDFLIALAKIHYSAGNFEKALETMKRAFALSAQKKEVSLTLALWMIDTEDSASGLKIAKQVLAKQPEEPLALWICALAYLKQKDIPKAMTYLNLSKESKAPFIRAVSIKMKEELKKDETLVDKHKNVFIK